MSLRLVLSGSTPGLWQLVVDGVETDERGMHPTAVSGSIRTESHVVRLFGSAAVGPLILTAVEVVADDAQCRLPPPLSTHALAGDVRTDSAAADSDGQLAVPVLDTRPGSANVIYLDFDGENVTETEWNTQYGGPMAAAPFSMDSNMTAFSAKDIAVITTIVRGVAEDYAPWDISITTSRARYDTADVSSRSHCVITNSVFAGFNTGGVAHMYAFPDSDYWQPTWIFASNLDMDVQHIASAAAHELGHQLGLFHDGRTGLGEYYPGHGIGATSWAPIMGLPYGASITQWSDGDYFGATNTQDDVYDVAWLNAVDPVPDDVPDSPAQALALDTTSIQAGAVLASGVISNRNDADAFLVVVEHAGPFALDVTTLSQELPGMGNLDVRAELYDANDGYTLIHVSDSPDVVTARVQAQATSYAKNWVVVVRGTGWGHPASANTTGYSNYGSLGAYTLSVSRWPAAPALCNSSSVRNRECEACSRRVSRIC
ncbi:uncharacterized protein AMSG_10847 [Thecamonas trahens ATCC 50062]|uniref:Uncharacterized protein n=1 Tax=Thecamonas trahens ATCC 50062 TaxID=461836 RepID=A0A0L0DSH5_THETB|nr:hypothetical protein AMSG_10847 [Thecamonas trahens ATCC 50062]KNC55220.1 hypothetical protein AMSG_10847 [Thecamonas trahens ATCC 50062]|eukprot:XP_013753150.1 hypothetical protein AMSG_10847 [Thecamonas trahens ATCC 50062]